MRFLIHLKTRHELTHYQPLSHRSLGYWNGYQGGHSELPDGSVLVLAA